MKQHTLQQDDKLLFKILSGKAVFTIKSKETGQHFTFRIVLPERFKNGDPTKKLWWVHVLNGSDNTSDYLYIGTIYQGVGNEFNFAYGKKSKLKEDNIKVVSFRWFFNHLSNHRNISHLIDVYHQGHCLKCGRPLTVPSSIESGMGPKCSSY